jgi:type VI protein secretion system component VasK
MNTVLKFLLYFLALTFLALVCWGVTLYFYWPAWTTPAFFFGTLAALWLGRWLKRWVLVYRSKRQIAQAVAQTQMPAPAPSSAMSLEEQWEEAVRTLRQSNLKRLGDPLYILPWYLVLGAPGSGRSAMLRQARSASPLKDIIQTGEVSGEGRGEWWYLNNAVVIEPAGSYALPQNEAQDREEWETLLTLLGKYRKKEPLNGLIVTIAADRLLTAGPEALAEEGRFIRKRVDQLMRLLDIKFPVYVMVTKCDVLYGFEDWSRHLPDRTLEQTMGQIGGDELAEGKAFLDRTFDSIVERLKDLRLVVAHRLGGMNLRLLLLPQEFERLKPGLDAFWTGGFCSDPYLDSPFLRGLLFCSSQQQPSLPSLALKERGVETAPAAPVGPPRGLFLRDFFQIVLPEDRGYFKPLGYGLQWQQFSQKVGLGIWLLVGLIAFAALTISFGYSVTTMNRLREEYPGARTFTGKFQPDLETMSRYIPMLKQMEERDEQWFIRLVPFNQQVMQLESDLQDAFANDFRRVLLTDMDDAIARQLDALAAQAPEPPSALPAAHRPPHQPDQGPAEGSGAGESGADALAFRGRRHARACHASRGAGDAGGHAGLCLPLRRLRGLGGAGRAAGSGTGDPAGLAGSLRAQRQRLELADGLGEPAGRPAARDPQGFLARQPEPHRSRGHPARLHQRRQDRHGPVPGRAGGGRERPRLARRGQGGDGELVSHREGQGLVPLPAQFRPGQAAAGGRAGMESHDGEDDGGAQPLLRPARAPRSRVRRLPGRQQAA